MTDTAKYSVFAIADWFLLKAKSEEEPLKHMKLQKLVYFAYGWYYAYYDVPLFKETIFAWRHGPVVRDLYHKYKSFSNRPITVKSDTLPELEEEVISMLNYVWQVYSQCTDVQLRNITHRSNSPWSKSYNSDEWYAEISPESIKNYFKELIKKYKNN
jgi:uncharacterized phage-associated protein